MQLKGWLRSGLLVSLVFMGAILSYFKLSYARAGSPIVLGYDLKNPTCAGVGIQCNVTPTRYGAIATIVDRRKSEKAYFESNNHMHLVAVHGINISSVTFINAGPACLEKQENSGTGTASGTCYQGPMRLFVNHKYTVTGSSPSVTTSRQVEVEGYLSTCGPVPKLGFEIKPPLNDTRFIYAIYFSMNLSASAPPPYNCPF